MAFASQTSCTEIQVYGGISSRGKETLHLFEEHLLSLLHVRHEEGETLQVAIHKLLQQPVEITVPYELYPTYFSIVPYRGNQNPMIDSGLQSIMVITNALPVSIGVPQGYVLDATGLHIKQDSTIKQKFERIEVRFVDLDILPKSDRKRCWYIEDRGRQKNKNHVDKYYYHLLSNAMCRSLVEVHSIIENGKLPTRNSKAKSDQDPDGNAISASGLKRLRGSSLLTRKEVGYYDKLENYMYRSKTLLTEEVEQSKKSKKRKRGESSSAHEGQNSQDANSDNSSARRFFALYDFELRE